MAVISLLQWFPLFIALFATLNFTDWIKFKNNNPLNKLLGFSSAYIGLHALVIFIIQYGFVLPDSYEWLAPFPLMYGPFLYFVFLILHKKQISNKQIIIHAALFLIFLILYLPLISLNVHRATLNYFAKSFSAVSLVSFCSYMIFSIHAIFKPVSGEYKAYKIIVIIGMVLLFFGVILTFVGAFFSNSLDKCEASYQILNFLMYCCMFCGIWIIHKFRKLLHKDFIEHMSGKQENGENGGDLRNGSRYEKSLLSIDQLDIYLEKLKALMEEDKVYLVKDLSLDKLATLMRVPKHHITQVLSLKIGASFYSYVNGYRIKHAALLLKSDNDDSIDFIAEQSGFNSRGSFNRHFKSVYGISPSEFRLQNKTLSFS